MKFTCDSCGAQYMIGDEKLGRRGVKVRCKKCSYVIILRPAGYQPGDKKTSSDHKEERASSQSEPSVTLPPEAMAPTVPFSGQTPFASDDGDEPADAVFAGTSSELGLSKEFAAMGFEEEDKKARARAAEARVKTLNVGLDVGKVSTPSFPDASSPFQIGRIGGSLTDPPDPSESERESDSDPLQALGASLPKLHHDDEPVEETSVDSRTPFGAKAAPPPPPDDREAVFGDDSTGESTAPGTRAPAGLDDLLRTQDGLGAGDVPDESFEDRGTAADPSPTVTDEVAARKISFDDPAAVAERISAMDRNELEDMESSLNRDLSSSSESKPVKKPENGAHRGGKPTSALDYASLAALASAETDEPGGAGHERPPVGARQYGAVQDGRRETPAAPAVTSYGHDNGDHRSPASSGESPLLDSEINGAFDAMFSPAVVPSQSYQEGGLAANTVQEQAPVELFRSAYEPEDAGRRPTRVFDVEAMQQVQAEQDLASQPANGNHRLNPLGSSAGLEAAEWYVAINDEQVGPLTMGDVRARWENGEVGPASLCWKQGMPDWTAIRGVKEMEALGDMDDRVRTVVARIEPNDEPEEHPDEPPTIAMPEDKPKLEEPPVATKEEPAEEPSWRPSAASALASLAAMELGGESAPASKKDDVAVGRALPATSDALEKLLQGDTSKSAASAFGAMEQSSSAIRPLPKRAEIASSVSLRDPVSSRNRPAYPLILAIVGGFIFLGICVILGIRFMTPQPQPQLQPPPQQVAMVPAQPAQTAPQPVPAQPAVPQPPLPATTDPSAANGTQPAGATAAQPATAQTAQAVQPGQPAQPAQPDAAAASKPEESKEEARPAGEKKKRAATAGLGGTGTKRAAREPKEKEPLPAAAPAKAKPAVEDEVDDDEDLLPGPKKRVRPAVAEESSELPKQLEDSDILGAMRKNKASITACLQKQKSADPGLEGTMIVNFVIEGNGSTKRWSVSPDKFKSSVVGKCVIDAVKGWSFPKFSGRPMPVDFPVRVAGGR